MKQITQILNFYNFSWTPIKYKLIFICKLKIILFDALYINNLYLIRQKQTQAYSKYLNLIYLCWNINN